MIGARSPEPLPDFPPGVVPLFDVPHDTVMAAWERALFGVFPSVVPEALGNVVHEAMSQGRAVVGTRPGGHVDMIEEGKTGMLLPSGDVQALADAMRRLLSAPQLRERMGEAGRLRAASFTSEVVVPEIEQLYELAAVRSR
jgi:glycosyltransferase involved in cell wall biosynthesis